MDNEKRNSAAEEGRPNHGRAEAAFCQELLSCCVCEKIYFTRRPIRLRTSRHKSYHVCLDCSRKLTCSLCHSLIAARASAVVEKTADFPAGILCPACRDKIMFRFQPQPSGFRRRMRLAASSASASVLRFLRKLKRIRIKLHK